MTGFRLDPLFNGRVRNSDFAQADTLRVSRSVPANAPTSRDVSDRQLGRSIVDIQNLVETGRKEQLPVEALRGLAGNSAAFGQDIIETFAAQAERRAVAAG